MRLLDYLNTYGLEKLDEAPYLLKITEENGFYMFKYNFISSNFSLREVQDARGSIFRRDENGKWFYVCRPFDKFFNYGESQAAAIDWTSAKVLEKIDGSLMKIWYFDGWHLSTNGTISAFNASIGDEEHTFGDEFIKILGSSIEEFVLAENLDRDITYMFEITSKNIPHVISSYGNKIWFLAARRNSTGEYVDVHFTLDKISYPRQFSLKKFEDVLMVVSDMSSDEEGVVVSDAFGNRIKVKSPEYLVAAHLKGNNEVLIPKKVVEMVRNESLDDYLAYFPDSNGIVVKVLEAIEREKARAEREWELNEEFAFENRKIFYFHVRDFKYCDFLMKKYKNRDYTVSEYFSKMYLKKLLEIIE